MERHDYDNVTNWSEEDLFDTSSHLAEQLRDKQLYREGSERRQALSRAMGLVCFEEYMRYQEQHDVVV